MTRIRKRLPLAMHMQAFTLVLEMARQKGLLREMSPSSTGC